MRSLTTFLTILGAQCLSVQADNMQVVGDADSVQTPLIYNPHVQEIQISISEALYDFGAIDNNSFSITYNQPSIGLSYQKALAGKLNWQVSGYYTEHRFRHGKLDSNIQISGPPVLEKNFTYVDIIGALTYDFQECTGVKAYITTGIGAGILIKGNRYIKGLEKPEYAENPTLQFSSTAIILIGVGMKYYFLEHFGLDFKFLAHRNTHNVIRGENKKYPQMRLEAGIYYAF